MKLTVTRVLWLLAAVLLAGVVGESLSPGAPGPDVPPPGQAVGTPAAAAAVEPVDSWIATVLARPLFSRDRRPSAVVAAASAAAEDQPLPRLAGIIVSPRGRLAIFADEGDHSTTAAEGASVGSWKVTSIHAQDVEMAGPDGPRTLRPSFTNTPAVADATPANPPFPLRTPPGLPPGSPLLPGGPFPFNATAQQPGGGAFGNTLPRAVRTRP